VADLEPWPKCTKLRQQESSDLQRRCLSHCSTSTSCADFRSRVYCGAVELTLASKASVGELRAAIGHLNLPDRWAPNQRTQRMQIANSPSQIEPPPVIAGANISAAECEPLCDTELTARVKAALVAAGDLTGKQILIEAVDGVVFLSGSVDSAEMKQVTLAAAERVFGAHKLRDYLVVRDGTAAR
jgi:hypothetical protein